MMPTSPCLLQRNHGALSASVSAQGLWKGRPFGPGRYRWKNGNEFDGEWRDGKMHGQVRCCQPVTKELVFIAPALGRA